MIFTAPSPLGAGGLRLLAYDATCRGGTWAPGLSTAWGAGAALYRALGRLDAARGVASWSEALAFLASHEPEAALEEVQFWGHGRFGCVFVGKERLGVDELASPAHAAALDAICAMAERVVRGARRRPGGVVSHVLRIAT